MLEQLKRPQLKAPSPGRPAPPPLKPATEPATPMPSGFTRPLEKPTQKKQRKACPACEEEGTTCPGCQKKAAPTLERPPSETQMRGGSPGADPAERQADELGKDIGEELKGTGSVGHGPLPKSVQDVAETHLGVSLEGTYVDSGSTGQKKAKDESALAVTEGKRIAFGEGQLSTASAEGRALLGHELVHVGQQSAERRMASQRQALSAQKDSAKGGAPPNSLKAVRAALASKPPDVVGALKILNGRSMAELLKWLRTLGPRAAWSIRSAAYSVGGPRLVAAIDIAIHGGYLGEVAVERLNAVVSTLPPDQRNAIVAFLRADGLQSWLLVLLVLPHKVVLSREKFLQANADLGVTLSRIDGAVLVGPT